MEIIWIPNIIDAGGIPLRDLLREFAEKEAVKVVVPLYIKMLETHREVFKGVFGWLREWSARDGAFLFHCTGT